MFLLINVSDLGQKRSLYFIFEFIEEIELEDRLKNFFNISIFCVGMARVLTALAKVYDREGIFKIFLGPRPIVVVFKQNTSTVSLFHNFFLNNSILI